MLRNELKPIKTLLKIKWAVLQRNDVWEPREQTDPGSLSLCRQAGCRTWYTQVLHAQPCARILIAPQFIWDLW